MKASHFITDQFLLQSDAAEYLYQYYAKDLPIIDYHNHLSPKEIAENKPIANITKAWLQEDHYKWRAMRANGIDEQFITGKATSLETKFLKWAETVPYTLRNPLFHWTHLELKRYFDINEILQPSAALAIYEKANSILATKTPAQLLQDQNVEVICTTDDPTDDLNDHETIAGMQFFTKVYPTFRPDNLLQIEKPTFVNYIKKLEEKVGYELNNLASLKQAISDRIDYFEERGCKLSDYGLSIIYADDFTENQVDAIFRKKLNAKELTSKEEKQYASCILHFLCTKYKEKDWVQQFHLGALRNNNQKIMQQIGLDAGVDSIGDFKLAKAMSRLFNNLDATNQLAKTICYNLNPSQNEVFATMMGNFQNSDCPGKMQWGSGWWFLDQKDGMEKQLNCLSNMGLLSRFVGMLTDSRSFLSFPRHEYFRRILCNLLAEDLQKGLIPNDLDFLGNMVQDICYRNAKNYFNFKN